MIPKRGLEGVFLYRLNLPKARVRFSQFLSETRPMYNGWNLFFMFGEWFDPDNASAGFCPDYSDVKLNFGTCDYMEGVDLQCQNIDMRDTGFGSCFTKRGMVMLEDFLGCSDNWRKISGMKDDDSEKLGALLERVRTEYEAGTLYPGNWNYGV